MKQALKQFAKSTIDRAVSVAGRTLPGRYVFERILSSVTSNTRSIRHGAVELTFAAPNRLNHWRIDTFATKEPETLAWIDAMPQGCVLWDIGANIGLYTCYAAKARGCRVFAFEPSVFNLELLARNIFLNALAGQAIIVPLPLSESLGFGALNMTSTEWGGALSSFGSTFGHDGRTMAKLFEFQTVGLSMADARVLLRIPQPDYIKMDVDGIEHLILKGGADVLGNVAGVLVEINDEFEQQRTGASHYLSEAGLVLKEKRHADMFESSSHRYTFNQIWQRPATATQ